MKKVLLSGFLFSLSLAVIAQNAPVDFEEDGFGADWNWVTFENDTNPPIEILANPDPSGINTSATVAKYTTLPTGNPWAGCETMHGSDIGTFTIDAENSIIRIMVWKSVISDVGIKLVRFDNWSLGEILVPNTLVDQWEQITFDFSEHIGLQYDQLVLFLDFAERDQENIIYWDNVFGEAGVVSNLPETSFVLPSISPNPANTVVQLRSQQNIEVVTIYNLAGEIVLQEQTATINPMITINHLSEGLYILETIIEGRHSSQKLVIK